ncbi:MAG: hypothetical protein IPG50_15450 [Myxococcales bacterium]|nr:hypothetical protein [Myxococcales bacterium]
MSFRHSSFVLVVAVASAIVGCSSAPDDENASDLGNLSLFGAPTTAFVTGEISRGSPLHAALLQVPAVARNVVPKGTLVAALPGETKITWSDAPFVDRCGSERDSNVRCFQTGQWQQGGTFIAEDVYCYFAGHVPLADNESVLPAEFEETTNVREFRLAGAAAAKLHELAPAVCQGASCKLSLERANRLAPRGLLPSRCGGDPH